MKPVTYRSTTAEDARRVRKLRLEMLQNAPEAFGQTLASARAENDEYWQERAARGSASGWCSFAAIEAADTGHERWVGTMAGYVDDEYGPVLVSVYVAPDYRGRDRGISDALLDRIERWAYTLASRLTLHVAENNASAQRFYLRRGYRLTGEVLTAELTPTKRELVMTRDNPVPEGSAR